MNLTAFNRFSLPIELAGEDCVVWLDTEPPDSTLFVSDTVVNGEDDVDAEIEDAELEGLLTWSDADSGEGLGLCAEADEDESSSALGVVISE